MKKMEKQELVKRGIYKKVARQHSPNNSAATKLRSIQEKIRQLKEIKPAQKFLREERIQSRLRKSMLVRAFKESEKNFISSTPHPTKTQNDQFFGNNFSVILSPISVGRRSNNENIELINNDKNNEKKIVLEEHNSSTSEILNNIDKNSSKLSSLQKHSLSVICISSDNDQEERRTSLRKSKKDQATNRSKIGETLNNVPDKDLNKLNNNKSFGSRENSPVKRIDKSLEESPVKLPTEQTGVKKSRIPIRTASQEKEKAIEQTKPITRIVAETPKKNKSTNDINTEEENNTPTNKRTKAREKRRSSSTPTKSSRQQNNSLIFEQNTEVNKNKLSKRRETYMIKDSSNKNVRLSKGNNIPPDNNTSVQNSEDESPSLKKNEVIHDKNDNNQEHVSLSPVILNTEADIPVIIVEAPSVLSADHINRSRPSAVRFKPSEKSEMFAKSIGLSPIIDKNIALSPSKGGQERQETQILQNTRLEKSFQFAEDPPDISKSPRTPGKALNKSITRLMSNAVPTTESNEVPKETENNNRLSQLLVEISAKKNKLPRTSGRIRRTVNREVQTSIIDSFIYNNANVRTTRTRRQATSRYKEQAYVEKDVSDDNQSLSRGSSNGCGNDIIQSSYNFDPLYSHMKHNIFESLEEGNELDALGFSESDAAEVSVFNDLSKPNNPWRFVNDGLVPEKSDSVNLSFISTENQISARQSGDRTLKFVQNQENLLGHSCDSDDSGHSSSSPKNNTLRSNRANATADTIMTEAYNLNRDTTVSSKFRRRQYNKKGQATADTLKPPPRATRSRDVASARTGPGSARMTKNHTTSVDNNISIRVGNTMQQTTEKQVCQQNEIVTSPENTALETTFGSKASKRLKTNNRNVSTARSSFESSKDIVVSLSSADQKLLGVKPLLDTSPNNKRTYNVESQQYSVNLHEDVTTRNKQTYASKNRISNKEIESNFEEVENLNEERNSLQSIQDVPNMNSDRSSDENNIEQQQNLNEGAAEVNQQGSRTKMTKKRGRKKKSNKPSLRLTRTEIDRSNILLDVGGGRPQRNRKPPKLAVNILCYLESDAKKFGTKNTTQLTKRRGRTKKTSGLEVTKERLEKGLTGSKGSMSSADNNNPVESEKKAKSVRGRGRPKKTPGITIANERTEEPIANSEEGMSSVQSTNPEVQDSEIGQPNMDNEIMPPPNGISIVNSMYRTKTQGNFPTLDSGFETINTLKKKLRTNSDDGATSCDSQGDHSLDNDIVPPSKGQGRIKTRTRRKLSGVDNFESTSASENNSKITSATKTRGRKKKNVQNQDNGKAVEELSVLEPSEQYRHETHEENIGSPSRVSAAEQSLTAIRTGGVTKSHKKQNVAKDVADKVSRVLEKLSESSRELEQSVGFSERSNGLVFNGSNRTSTSFQFSNRDCVTYVMGGEIHTLKYANRIPADNEYKNFGNLDVTETVKYSKDNFSAGFIRLHPGDWKRPTITIKYSFIYTVVSGNAGVQCHNQTSTMQQGDFFVIPVGMEYAIQNLNPKSYLLLSYVKIKST